MSSHQPAEPVHFTHTSRVYWEDTDAGGVVYYANYLKFLERARSEWLTSAGISQTELSRDRGIYLVVRQVLIDYHQSARLEDELLVTVGLTALGGASMDIFQTIRRADEAAPVVTARVRVACLDGDSWKPRRLPADLKSGLSQFCLN